MSASTDCRQGSRVRRSCTVTRRRSGTGRLGSALPIAWPHPARQQGKAARRAGRQPRRSACTPRRRRDRFPPQKARLRPGVRDRTACPISTASGTSTVGSTAGASTPSRQKRSSALARNVQIQPWPGQSLRFFTKAASTPPIFSHFRKGSSSTKGRHSASRGGKTRHQSPPRASQARERGLKNALSMNRRSSSLPFIPPSSFPHRARKAARPRRRTRRRPNPSAPSSAPARRKLPRHARKSRLASNGRTSPVMPAERAARAVSANPAPSRNGAKGRIQPLYRQIMAVVTIVAVRRLSPAAGKRQHDEQGARRGQRSALPVAGSQGQHPCGQQQEKRCQGGPCRGQPSGPRRQGEKPVGSGNKTAQSFHQTASSKAVQKKIVHRLDGGKKASGSGLARRSGSVKAPHAFSNMFGQRVQPVRLSGDQAGNGLDQPYQHKKNWRSCSEGAETALTKAWRAHCFGNGVRLRLGRLVRFTCFIRQFTRFVRKGRGRRFLCVLRIRGSGVFGSCRLSSSMPFGT